VECSELVHRSDSFFQVLLCFETITIVLLFFPAFGLSLGSNSHEDEALYQKISSEGSLALPQHRRAMLFGTHGSLVLTAGDLTSVRRMPHA